MLCVVFSLCYVCFVDAFNPRKRGLARFARCGRVALAAGPSGPQMKTSACYVLLAEKQNGYTLLTICQLSRAHEA